MTGLWSHRRKEPWISTSPNWKHVTCFCVASHSFGLFECSEQSFLLKLQNVPCRTIIHAVISSRVWTRSELLTDQTLKVSPANCWWLFSHRLWIIETNMILYHNVDSVPGYTWQEGALQSHKSKWTWSITKKEVLCIYCHDKYNATKEGRREDAQMSSREKTITETSDHRVLTGSRDGITSQPRNGFWKIHRGHK